MHFVNGVVFSAGLPASVAVECDGRGMTIDAQRLILATGAFERPLPVPGWTLPGVMTTGAAQTLLRSYGVVAGRRMLIAGNGRSTSRLPSNCIGQEPPSWRWSKPTAARPRQSCQSWADGGQCTGPHA